MYISKYISLDAINKPYQKELIKRLQSGISYERALQKIPIKMY